MLAGAPDKKNWRILLEQSFTARMPVLMAATLCLKKRKPPNHQR